MNFALLSQQTASPDLTRPVLDGLAAAIQRQLIEHVSILWQAVGARVYAVDRFDQIATDDAPIVLLNDSDQAGDLGYHSTAADGRPYARVFVAPILSSGGSLLQGSNSVACTTSHEVLEAWGDPYASWWADVPDGQLEDALELCDRTESDSYVIDGISVSNFLGPRAFSVGPGPYDYLGLLAGPFDIRPGGYAIRRQGGPTGTTAATWGANYPVHKADAKLHPAARSYKRGLRAI